ncbi:MAG TPA: hypothetical protein VNT56_00295 [Acidimicrobiales bacterium]|jgi:hypothetical protein|nr:hypothetical protein [Acidimicrobiales bacterium]
MATHAETLVGRPEEGLIERLNGRWHRPALAAFALVVIAHWVEHLVQVVQIYVLGWAVPEAKGALGLVFPHLVTEEWLHYGYALVMLAGIVILMPGFAGRARWWWGLSLGIQVWHHFEHLFLFLQAQTGIHFLGRAVPTSFAQLVVPRVELHLFYNVAVFLPMLVALFHHLYPTGADRDLPACACSRLRPATATATAGD